MKINARYMKLKKANQHATWILSHNKKVSPHCTCFMRRIKQTDGRGCSYSQPVCCAVWHGDTIQQSIRNAAPLCISYRADWKGFLLCRCWIGRGLHRYLSILWQGQGIREASTVLPWFPVQLCLHPTPMIAVLCWPSESHQS